MTLKESIFRELLYGPTLDGLMPSADDFRLDHLEEDARLEPDGQRDEDNYPDLIFRRVNEPEMRNGVMVVEDIEFEIIGLQTSATKGSDLLESIKNALRDRFHGRKTHGKYDADGNADADGGLKVTGSFQGATEDFDDILGEKILLVSFRFAYPL